MCSLDRTARCWHGHSISARYQFTGNPVSIAERLWYYKPTGLTQFAISDTGVLAYHGGPSVSELVWLDRTGRQVGTLGTRGSYHDVRISPNGREVAVVVVDPRTRIVGHFDLRPGIRHPDEVHLECRRRHPAGLVGRR